jgi:hypothetical protein
MPLLAFALFWFEISAQDDYFGRLNGAPTRVESEDPNLAA